MKTTILSIILGFILGLITMFVMNNSQSNSMTEDKPLYWVAPMDANYRRDKPGKSPMGMDLIPYYGDKSTGSESGQGVVRINADVINNLGVRTTKVIKKALHFEINTVGYVAYDEDSLVHIHPRIEGWVEKLYVKASGDKVEKGQALYDIYSPALVNAQEELLLALSRNNKRLISAAKERLYALQLPQSAIARLIKTRKVQQHITFYSPQSGFVDKLEIRQGFFVKPGKTLMQIGTLDQVWIEAEVIESQISYIVADLPVTMKTDAIPTKVWQGKINYIYPTLDAKNRTLRVRILFDNPDKLLKPNMFANIQIHNDLEQELLVIPKEAVIRTGKTNRVVLALGQGQFKSIEIEIGKGDDNYYEVISGLAQGEEVVVSAQFLLDSESSKTSDFKRMNHAQNKRATVLGTINSIMHDMRMLNISRAAIVKWNRPAATLDFSIDDKIGLANLEENMQVKFTFEIRNGNFTIIDIRSVDTVRGQ